MLIIKGRRVNRNYIDAFFTFGMSIFASIMMGFMLFDINAQPKIFHRSFLPRIQCFPNDFSLDLFLMFQAKKNGYTILDFPVKFEKRIFGKSKGGGTFRGKVKLIYRTFKYIYKLRKELR